MDDSTFSMTFFFFNDTATTEIYTLSLHDALPIYLSHPRPQVRQGDAAAESRLRFNFKRGELAPFDRDRKSTRLNSSHSQISYAVFCLKKKRYTKLLSTHANIVR